MVQIPPSKRPDDDDDFISFAMPIRPEFNNHINDSTDMRYATDERHLLDRIYGNPQPPLPYSMHTIQRFDGTPLCVYDIPEEERLRVFSQLYPFSPIPKLTETWYDLHEQKDFQLRDFLVVREDDGNYLVSPYYPRSGGTVLDWIRKGAEE